jgi:hypothetical protein
MLVRFSMAFKPLGERATQNLQGLRQMKGLSLPENLGDGKPDAKFNLTAVEIPHFNKTMTERAEVMFKEATNSPDSRQLYAIYARLPGKKGRHTLQAHLYLPEQTTGKLLPISLDYKPSYQHRFNQKELKRLISDGRSAAQYLDEEV